MFGEENNFIIRVAENRDCASISNLCGQLGYPSTEDEIEYRLNKINLDENHVIYVAESSQNNVIGWIHAYICQILESDFKVELGGLIVDEQYRRKGVGKHLLDSVEKWASDKGCTKISVRSGSTRKEAHVFYEKVGYKKVKEQYTFRKEL